MEIKPGKYIVAVSGGVDSMVLLDLLSKIPKLELAVAHINEGLRADSTTVQQMVKKTAAGYNLPFYTTDAALKSSAEALGRKVRYQFLTELADKLNAAAIITAHHQDDLIETAILNLLRGSGRRGLTSLRSRAKLLRPLLQLSKEQLYKYAKNHSLQWHEDPMNKDLRFLRNYVRYQILPRLSKAKKQALLAQINKLGKINQEIEEILESQITTNQLDRKWFINLPDRLAHEIMAAWLRKHKASVDAKTLNRLTIAAKTYQAGKKADINKKRYLLIETKSLSVV